MTTKNCAVDTLLENVEIKSNDNWKMVEVNGERKSIPSDWGVSLLGSSFDISGGGTPPTADEQYWGGGITWVGPKFMGDDRRFVDVKHLTMKTLTAAGAKKVAPKPTPAGSLIVSSRAPVGYANMAPCDLYTNQGCYSLVDNGVGLPEFAYFWIRKNRKLLESRASGTTFLEISRKTLSLLDYPSPARKEQSLVSKVLVAQESHVAFLRDQSALERHRLAWLSDELLSGRLRVENDPNVDDVVIPGSAKGADPEVLSGVRLVANKTWKSVEMNGELVEIPCDWSAKKVKDIASNTSGATPPTNEKRYWGGALVWVTPRDMDNLDGPYLVGSGKTLSAEGYAFMKNRVVKPGSIVFSTRGSIGKVACAKSEIRISQSCESFLFASPSAEFFVYFFRKHMAELKKMGAGTTFMSITKKDIDGISVLIPPDNEQLAIAKILTTQEAQISSIELLADAEQKRLDWLSDELLSGRLRVRLRSSDQETDPS